MMLIIILWTFGIILVLCGIADFLICRKYYNILKNEHKTKFKEIQSPYLLTFWLTGPYRHAHISDYLAGNLSQTEYMKTLINYSRNLYFFMGVLIIVVGLYVVFVYLI